MRNERHINPPLCAKERKLIHPVLLSKASRTQSKATAHKTEVLCAAVIFQFTPVTHNALLGIRDAPFDSQSCLRTVYPSDTHVHTWVSVSFDMFNSPQNHIEHKHTHTQINDRPISIILH